MSSRVFLFICIQVILSSASWDRLELAEVPNGKEPGVIGDRHDWYDYVDGFIEVR